MIIRAWNPETDNLEKSYLVHYQNVGETTIELKNADRFGAGKILIGDMGGERSEIRQVSAVSDRTLSIDALNQPHEPDDSVYMLQYDMIRFLRADTEAGPYTQVAELPIDVDNADHQTVYEDTAATSTSLFKTQYYNSITNATSEPSEPIQATGAHHKSAGDVIDEVVRRVRDPGYTVLGVEEYLDLMQEVNDDLLTQSTKPYVFLKRSVMLDLTAGQSYIQLPDDFWKFDRIEISTGISGSTRSYAPDVISLSKWDNFYNSSQLPASDHIRQIAVDDVNLRIYLGPAPLTSQTGVVELFYYKMFDMIENVGDLVETPNTLIYKYKMLAEYYHAKSEADLQFSRLADTYEGKYGAEVVKMQRVNRIDVGTPRQIKPQYGYRRYYTL